jgi:hypothetical protein
MSDGLFPAVGTVTSERISLKEAAFILGVSQRTANRWASELGTLGVKLGGQWRLDRVRVELLKGLGTAGYIAAVERGAHRGEVGEAQPFP